MFVDLKIKTVVNLCIRTFYCIHRLNLSDLQRREDKHSDMTRINKKPDLHFQRLFKWLNHVTLLSVRKFIVNFAMNLYGFWTSIEVFLFPYNITFMLSYFFMAIILFTLIGYLCSFICIVRVKLFYVVYFHKSSMTTQYILSYSIL